MMMDKYDKDAESLIKRYHASQDKRRPKEDVKTMIGDNSQGFKSAFDINDPPDLESPHPQLNSGEESENRGSTNQVNSMAPSPVSQVFQPHKMEVNIKKIGSGPSNINHVNQCVDYSLMSGYDLNTGHPHYAQFMHFDQNMKHHEIRMQQLKKLANAKKKDAHEIKEIQQLFNIDGVQGHNAVLHAKSVEKRALPSTRKKPKKRKTAQNSVSMREELAPIFFQHGYDGGMIAANFHIQGQDLRNRKRQHQSPADKTTLYQPSPQSTMLQGDMQMYSTFPLRPSEGLPNHSTLSAEAETKELDHKTQTATEEQPTPSPSQRDGRHYARSPELGFIKNSIYAGQPPVSQQQTLLPHVQSEMSSHMQLQPSPHIIQQGSIQVYQHNYNGHIVHNPSHAQAPEPDSQLYSEYDYSPGQTLDGYQPIPTFPDGTRIDPKNMHLILKTKLQPSLSNQQNILEAIGNNDDGIGIYQRDIKQFIPHQFSLLFQKSSRLQHLVDKNNQKKMNLTSREKQPVEQKEVVSKTMNCFKDSILQNQIKMQVDPNRWMPTAQLVHEQRRGSNERSTSQKQKANQHLAPPSFKVMKQGKMLSAAPEDLNKSQEFKEKDQSPKQEEQRKHFQEAALTEQLQTGAIQCSKAVINKINLSKVQLKETYVSQVQIKNLKIPKGKSLKEVEVTPGASVEQINYPYPIDEVVGTSNESPGPRHPKLDSLLAWQHQMSSKTNYNEGTNELVEHLRTGMDDALVVRLNYNASEYKDRIGDLAGSNLNILNQPSPRSYLNKDCSNTKTETTDRNDPRRQSLDQVRIEKPVTAENATAENGFGYPVAKKITEALVEESYSANRTSPHIRTLTNSVKTPKTPKTPRSRSQRLTMSKASAHTKAALQPTIHPILGAKGSKLEGLIINEQNHTSSPRESKVIRSVELYQESSHDPNAAPGQTKMEIDSFLVESANINVHSKEQFKSKGSPQSDYTPNFLFKMKDHGSAQDFKKHTPAKGSKQGDFLTASKRNSGIAVRENSPRAFVKPQNSKMKHPKPNDDISQILDEEKSSLKQGSTMMKSPGQKESDLENRSIVIRQDSVQESTLKEKDSIAQDSGRLAVIEADVKKKTYLTTNATADPKYKLVKNTKTSDQTSEGQDSMEGSYRNSAYPDHGPFKIHDTSNYTIINIDGVLSEVANSKKTSHRLIPSASPAKVQTKEQDSTTVVGAQPSIVVYQKSDEKDPKDPKIVEWVKNNQKFLLAKPALSCSPGITNVLNNRARHFASTERTKKIQTLKLREEKEAEENKAFYARRFDRVDKQVAALTKAKAERQKAKEGKIYDLLKNTISKNYDLTARLHKKIDLKQSNTASVDRAHAQSSGDSVDDKSTTNPNFQFSEPKNVISFPVSKMVDYQNQTQTGAGRFGTKNNSLIQQQIPREGLQKFGDKKNTTQIFSNTIYMKKANNFTTIDSQTPIRTPLHIMRQHEKDDSSQFAHQIFTQSDQISYYQSGQDGGDYRMMTHNVPSQIRYRKEDDGEEDMGDMSLYSPDNDYRAQPYSFADKSQQQNKTAGDWTMLNQPHLRTMTIQESHMDDEMAGQGHMATFGDFSGEQGALDPSSGEKRLFSVELSRNKQLNQDYITLPALETGKGTKNKILMFREAVEEQKFAEQQTMQQKKMLKNIQLKEKFQFQRMLSNNSNLVHNFNQTQPIGFSMKENEKKKNKKLKEINSEKEKIKNFIKAESLYINQTKKLEKIVKEHVKGDSPIREQNNTFNRPKQSQYTNFLPYYKISRGADSGFENRTCNNFSPSNLLSEQIKNISVYDSKENERSISNEYPQDGNTTTPGGISNLVPVNKDISQTNDNNTELSPHYRTGHREQYAQRLKQDGPSKVQHALQRGRKSSPGEAYSIKPAPIDNNFDQMLQQMNTSTYRQHFDLNKTQGDGNFGSFKPDEPVLIHSPNPNQQQDRLYRRLTNQQGEVTGYASTYDYDSKASGKHMKKKRTAKTNV